MLTKFVKEQLDKSDVDLSNYELKDNKIIFHISKKNGIKLEENKSYLLELSEDALDKEASININFNNGNNPKCKTLKVFVSQVLGKMIYVDAVGDNAYIWSGWLNVGTFKILEELNVISC